MIIGGDIRVLMDKYYSGISEYTANLLLAILKIDKANEYKLFYNSYYNLDARLNNWNTSNSQVIGLHWPNKIFNYFLLKILRRPRLDKVLGGVDVFWSPHFNFTSLSSKESGLKKIITVHDLSFLRYPKFFNWRKNFWHKSLGVKTMLRNADIVIAVSENTKQDILELVGIDESKIRVIYSGNNVCRNVWSAEKIDSCLREQGISQPFILYVGNIEPRKNIDGLIKAYNQLRRDEEQSARTNGSSDKFSSLNLIIAGALGWKIGPIKAEWERSPYRDQIKFLGYINQETKEILYTKAKIFVYPSLYEGFGFPPLEAMTYGLPVVCSNVSSLPEIVADAGLMINPDRPDEIATAIKFVLSDEKLRERLITKGLERSLMFSWDKAARGYLEVFKELNERK